MKNYALSLLTALIATSGITYAEEEKKPAVQVTQQMQQFSDAYTAALKDRLGMQDVKVTFTQGPNGLGTVVSFRHDITLRQSRVILLDAVETFQQVLQNNPQFQKEFKGDQSDIRNINLVIDTYDESKEKSQQFGVSSVILSNGSVAYMGISHHTGGEVLMHKQPYDKAVRVARDQKLR